MYIKRYIYNVNLYMITFQVISPGEERKGKLR